MTLGPAVFDPWTLRDVPFGRDVELGDQLRHSLKYAVLAPSAHNAQPWLFKISDDGHGIELFGDRERGTPATDPQGRQLVISCGAALGNLRVAMRHYGLAHSVRLVPDARLPDLLASVRVIGFGATQREDDGGLFDAIPRRRTHRQPFQKVDLDDRAVAQICEEAERERDGAWLQPIEPGRNRLVLADLIEEGGRRLSRVRAFREESAEWIRDPRAATRDGIPVHALGHSEFADRFGPLVRLVVRNEPAAHQGRRDRSLALDSPLLAVLGTDGDTPHDWMIAGQALARLLLRARSAGVFASFFTQPVEVPALRRELQLLLGPRDCGAPVRFGADDAESAGYPQLVLRMGYGRDVLPTPRRSVDELVLHRGPVPDKWY